jgi:small-conductance mechanosensitive channel
MTAATPTPVLTVLADLWHDLRDPAVLWQVVTLAVCLALAWWLAASLRQRLAGRLAARQADGQEVGRQLKFVGGGFDRLLFPLIALGLVLIGRALLVQVQHANLLHVAVPLLFAFAIIRALVYLLRHVLPASGALAMGERWVALVVWVGVALHFTGLLPELLDAMEQVGFSIGKQRISLLLVLQGAASAAFTLLVSLWASKLFEQRLMAAESFDMSLRVALGRFVKAVLVLAAILLALAMAGIDLTVLSVFGGALGVGLGLGLQRIASNYFAGFIILLDRSIRLGDVITVDKYSGAVTHINTRYTVLKALDGTEAIVPNEMLVNSPVTNLSFTTSENRLAVQVSVAYDSDLDAVGKIMLDAAGSHPRVLESPAPMVFLRQFGADGLDLEMGFWISDPGSGTGNVRSDLNFAIWRGFQAGGIEIPFPQREVRVLRRPGRSGPSSGAAAPGGSD